MFFSWIIIKMILIFFVSFFSFFFEKKEEFFDVDVFVVDVDEKCFFVRKNPSVFMHPFSFSFFFVLFQATVI